MSSCEGYTGIPFLGAGRGAGVDILGGPAGTVLRDGCGYMATFPFRCEDSTIRPRFRSPDKLARLFDPKTFIFWGKHTMKTKLVLSAVLAALALTACAKQEAAPEAAAAPAVEAAADAAGAAVDAAGDAAAAAGDAAVAAGDAAAAVATDAAAVATDAAAAATDAAAAVVAPAVEAAK